MRTSFRLCAALGPGYGLRRCLLHAALLWLALVTLPPILAAQDVQLNVVERKLKNGMTVLMVERHDSPTVALTLRFRVGSVDDPRGETGIAHMLEHMMFKGTKTYGTTNYEAEVPLMAKIDRLYEELAQEQARRLSAFEKPDETKIQKLKDEMAAVLAEERKYIVKDEMFETYQRVGAVGLNASTGEDSTQYFLSLPSNQLELWAYLESDRIANPVFREFYAERDVVHEERRLRTDTEPQGALWENFIATAFQAHPYHNPIIGWASDIDGLKREEVLRYFKTFYAPNNCIAVIVGDINPEKTMAILEKYFGPLPPQPLPTREITEEPPQMGERRVSLVMDAQPMLHIGYHIPVIGSEDTYALEVMAGLLSGVSQGSSTGRLYKTLVLDKKLALRENADAMTYLYPSLFVVSISPAQGKSAEEVEKAVYEEIEKLQKEPPTGEELTRVRNGVDADLIRSLRSNFLLAQYLATAQHLTGSWRYLLTERDKLKGVTGEDVQRVAKKYFNAENRTVAEIRTTPPASPPPATASSGGSSGGASNFGEGQE
jgi:predicted Zn-dependent peptidase